MSAERQEDVVPKRFAYGVDEAGLLLDSARTKIYQLIASGELESILVGKRRKIPHIAIERFIARALQKKQPASEELSRKRAEAGRKSALARARRAAAAADSA